jgi:hypothetical protein
MALEFVLRNGNSYLADLAPRSAHGDTPAWQEGNLSNFQYLLQINMFAGRSFRDETLNPIMPWVLLKFETFDLRDVRNFRDLHYPVQAQTSEQREYLQARIDHSRPAGPDNAMFFVRPSNPSFVWLWLGRLPPFNGISPENDPFPSLQAAFFDPVLARRNSELPPEFFCQPEIFENLMVLDVAEIELPKWALTPMEFVYLHRKALESDHVSAHLHEWIDLFFGVASEGARARQCCNVYNPHLGPDVWKYAPEADTAVIERQLAQAGHLPPPLFDSLHPPRFPPIDQPKQDTFSVSFERADIRFAAVLASDACELKVASVHGDGAVMLYVVQREFVVKATQIGRLRDPNVRLHAKSSDGSWLLIGQENCVVRPKGINDCGRTPVKIEMVAASGNHIVFSARDGGFWQANLLSLDGSERICSVFYETPAAVDVSVEYHLLVVGTLEGSILLYSLTPGPFRMRGDLAGEIP